MADDDRRDSRRTPSSGQPIVPRAPTPSNDQLQAEIRRLRSQLQRPDLERRIERVENVANGELLGYVRKQGAQYAELKSELTRVATRFEAMTAAIGGWRSDISERMGDHSDRIATVEDRSARHEVRLQQLEELPPRVAVLELNAAGDARELSLTRSQQRRLDARAGVISTLGGALAALLSYLLGG